MGRWITGWDAEDPAFWAATGRRVARRNLWISVCTEHLGFSVWSLWSVLVLFMVPARGFAVTADDKFLLTSLVTLVGAVLRVPYTLAVPRFGGRNWTVFATVLLLGPAVLAAVAVGHPHAPLWVFLLAGGAAGVGGGNFSSSMANVNAFFPEREKGLALGINAGGGNLGVATVQLAGLAVIAVAGTAHPAYLPYLYLPLIVVAGLAAWRGMDNVAAARTTLASQLAVVKDPAAAVMSVLYVGTFGSFIGFSFAFGLVLQNQFGRTPLQAASLTFLGPLLGSLARPLGGRLADRYGGARVTSWTFAAMAAGTAVIVAASARHSLPLFTVAFTVLFVLSGAGNGATYKMIPTIYALRAAEQVRAGADAVAAGAAARRSASALIGLVGAVGAGGGVLVNLALRQSFLDTGDGTVAFAGFLVFYAGCVALARITLRQPTMVGTLAYENG